ncbi:MAG: PEGA domain-containing protein [Sandaracinaceae bacterium]
MSRDSFRALAFMVASVLAAWLGATNTAFAYAIPINIESVPPGATVYLDSTSNPPLGTTPLHNVRVERGNHTIIFQLLNHEEARLQVNVVRRRETFRAVLRALGTVEVSAGNAAAQGATVSVDGREVGGTLGGSPIRVTDLQPGRHQVVVSRQGYDRFEQWVEVGGGQLVRVAAVLQQSAPDTGSILVSGPAGAPVFMDGTARGASPTVIEGVAVGSHTVEIRPPGQAPFSQTVTVIAGQRATVTMSSSGGTLRVIASAPGAIISVDGEAVGPSPAVRENLAAGEHIVSATAEGFQRAQQTVTVTEGQQRVVSIEMVRDQGETGRILVDATVEGAAVIIDGEPRGQAPVVFTPPEPGPHAIVVRADGHQEYSTTCETRPGQNCEIHATLVPQQVRVRVAVQPGIRGAELLVDGTVVGPVPYDGTMPAGSHVVSVTAPGYEEFRQQVLLQPSSEVRPFDVTLLREGEELSAEQRQEQAQEEERQFGAAVTHGAAALPPGQASIDISLGWPYLGELRLNIGILEWLDAGFAVRSFGRLTDFEGRVRAGFRPIEQVAIGGQVRFGGGLGPDLSYGRASGYATLVDPVSGAMRMPENGEEEYNARPNDPTSTPFSLPTNSAFIDFELLGSLYFGDQGAFTLWVAVDVSSDEYAGHPLNSSVYLSHSRSTDVRSTDMEDYCVPQGALILSCDPQRETWARARLGGSLELVLARNWNLWFQLEGILNQAPRRIMGNLLGIEANDTQFYFRIGTTYKF